MKKELKRSEVIKIIEVCSECLVPIEKYAGGCGICGEGFRVIADAYLTKNNEFYLVSETKLVD